MLNKTLLMSGADFFASDSPINPYYGKEAINLSAAITEHNTILSAFESAGINIVQVLPPEHCQDGIYTANWALCYGDKAILARLPNARVAEEPYARSVLEKLGKTVLTVPGDYKYSGQGDSLICGKYLFAGSGYRSDPEAQQFAADTFDLELIQLHTVPVLDAEGNPLINASSGWPDSLFYDLDLAISVLREDLIGYCPEAFDETSRRKIEALPINKITVSYEEATKGFACNLVSTGDTVIMSAYAPKYRAEIEKHGLTVIPISAHELPKGGGYIRCVSLAI